MSANGHGVLEHTLRDILAAVNPVNDDWVARFQIIDEFRGVVGSLESLRGATVEPFGSFVSNLFSRWGDLDISIQLANGSFISSSGKKQRQKLLRDLMRAMRQRGGWNRLQLIPNARVPILKVESHLQNISCDISIDNLQGHMKSKLLLWINEIDTRFRDLVLLVKEWAKSRNLNNPKSGTFNSYSLCLLVIFHFQTCQPAIFPPLKDIYPGNVADDLQGLRANAEKLISETCATNIAMFRSNRQRAVNRSSLSELFISFLAKFSNISSRALESGISTYTGQWEHISSNTRWLPQTYALFVEDPFERPENSARAVNKNQMRRIAESFQSTRNRLVSANLNQSSLLGTLVRPQTFQLIPRNPISPAGTYQPPRPQWQTTEHLHSPNTKRGGGHRQPMRPQGLQRAVHSYSQVQPQYQSTTIQGHYNNSITTAPYVLQTYPNQAQQTRRPNNSTTTRPYVQTYHSQTQQTWRPRSGT